MPIHNVQFNGKHRIKYKKVTLNNSFACDLFRTFGKRYDKVDDGGDDDWEN